MTQLDDAYALLKTGTLWSSTGRCKGFGIANPGEAAQIDSYVSSLSAGQNPALPSLVTATGRGLVGMLAALAPAIVLPPPPPPPPLGTWGFSMHALKYGAAADAYVQRLAAAGAKLLRDDLYPGSSDASLERLLSLASVNGCKLVLVLAATNIPTNTTIRQWAAHVCAYADSHHPGVLVAVEPFNEPNPGFAPAAFASFQNAVMDGVHLDAKSPVKVWGGATNGTGVNASGWTAAVLDAGARFDEWSCHPYPAYGDTTFTAAQMLSLTISSAWAEMPALAAMLQSKRGYVGPIHATEWGCPTNPPGGTAPQCHPESVQADVFTQGYRVWKAWPYAGWLLFYTGQDDNTADTTSRENHFGAYRTDGSAKPVVAVMKA